MLTRWNRFDVRNGAVALGPAVMREVDHIFRELAVPAWRQAEPRELIPAADIYETESGLSLQVDLPGHDPKGIEVKVENDTLTLRSERKADRPEKGGNAQRLERSCGTFTRSFVLPRNVDPARVEARYEHGVLTLTLPRREEARPRVVEVKVSH